LTDSQIGSGFKFGLSIISPGLQINSGEEAYNAAHDFTAFLASAYRLSTRKITLSDLNNELLGLQSLIKHKRRLRKLWKVTPDPSYTYNCS
jgi:hypothetical protein